MAKGGVVFAYDYLGDDRGDFFGLTTLEKSIVDGLGQPVTDLALAHGDGGLERHGGGAGSGGGFFMNENVADLGAVAVRDDDLVFAGQVSDDFADFFGDFLLRFGGDFAILL